jgi:hypothetical protein
VSAGAVSVTIESRTISQRWHATLSGIRTASPVASSDVLHAATSAATEIAQFQRKRDRCGIGGDG